MVGSRSDPRRFVVAGSNGRQAGILGRLREKRSARRQRRAEKARIRGEVTREQQRREPGRQDGSPRGNF
jgi:hypothetical protein